MNNERKTSRERIAEKRVSLRSCVQLLLVCLLLGGIFAGTMQSVRAEENSTQQSTENAGGSDTNSNNSTGNTNNSSDTNNSTGNTNNSGDTNNTDGTNNNDTGNTDTDNDTDTTPSYTITLTVPTGYTPVIWIDGYEYDTTVSEDGTTATVDLSDGEGGGKTDAKVAQMYQYKASGAMIGLYVWRLSYDGTAYTATAVPELENVLGYTGLSIRSTGNCGIRYTAYMPTEKKTALLGTNGLSSQKYKMVKRGTLLITNKNYEAYKTFVLPGALTGDLKTKLSSKILDSVSYGYDSSGTFTYKIRSSDDTKETFTTILTNQPVKTYTTDLTFRSYVTLEDANGEQMTVYGALTTRNIATVAQQIFARDAGVGKTYEPGTDEYNYLAKVIADGKDSYTLSYDLAGGTVATENPTSYTRESGTVTIANPTKEGYLFTGWTLDTSDANTLAGITKTDSGMTIDATALSDSESCRDIKLTANWGEAQPEVYDFNTMDTCEIDTSRNLTVKASIPYYVQCYDNQYYLVAVNQNTQAVEYAVAKADRSLNPTFTLALADAASGRYNQVQTLDGTWIRAFMNQYAIAVKTDVNTYRVISSAKYVSHPENLAKSDSYTVSTSKKGIQGAEFIVDASNPTATEHMNDLGVGHVFLNLYASKVLDTSGTDHGNYEYNGKTYQFNWLSAYRATLQALNNNGISATIQVMLDKNAAALIHSKCKGSTTASLYSWEDTNQEAREYIEAMFCYIGEALADGSDGTGAYANNWILGNEVNSYGAYQSKGTMTDAEFFRSYAQTFRSFYNAIKATNSASQVYICLDQHWNSVYTYGGSTAGYSSKAFLDTFKAFMDTYDTSVNWNVALHPYSYPMTKNDFWNCDSTQVTDAVTSPYLTMKNIGMATDYIGTNLKNADGTTKHILLSEQGYSYNASSGSTAAEKLQATALCYSYYITACNPMIDAFIMRSLVDDSTETVSGLYFGLCKSGYGGTSDTANQKLSYAAYRDCDDKTKAAEYDYYTVVDENATDWSTLVANYSEEAAFPKDSGV